MSILFIGRGSDRHFYSNVSETLFASCSYDDGTYCTQTQSLTFVWYFECVYSHILLLWPEMYMKSVLFCEVKDCDTS